MIHALTIDVEDGWSILKRDSLKIPNAEPCEAVVRNTHWFLETLAEYKTKATFFILGEVAEKFPELVKQIQQAGHEIGSHGQEHRQLFKATRDEFFQEMSRCKKTLEDLTGQQVLGFRAPAFSLLPQTSWALEVLAELDFRYDSSIYPMSNTRYGWPGFNPEIHRLELESGRTIIEAPMSKVSIGFKELGVGGGHMVFFPYWYTQIAIKCIQKKRPAIIYIHPYEIDTLFSGPHAQLLRKCDIKTRLRCSIRKKNARSTSRKIKRMVEEFNFASLDEVIRSSLGTTKGPDTEYLDAIRLS